MNQELTQDILEVAVGVALVYTVLLSIGLTGYAVYKPRRSSVKTSNYEIVLVSKADERVQRSLLESIRYHVAMFGHITLVVDEGAPLLSMLRYLKGVRLIVVPSSYRRDLVGKGRALNYFVEHFVSPDKWYVFIDDDNLILDESFLYEIPYYESKGYVAGNGVLLPRPGRSKISYAMDWIRYMDDLTLYRFFTGLLGRPLLGLHGELLIVKGSVLKEVGFNTKTLTEDFSFAIELVKRKYKTWQSATRVSIKSPNSLKDLMFQRGRWFKGMIMDIKRSPAPMKLIVAFRSFTWVFNLAVSILLFPVLVYLGLVWYMLPGSIYYLATYTYGVIRSREPYLLLLIPLFGLIEVSSRIYGLVEVNDFVVIDKN
ncbi:MAG: glycosyltransferase family 2 protein [Desulfurococcus sp.]|nr:glycosyltransferase family 2 protein [Desulfurococcus sp.]